LKQIRRIKGTQDILPGQVRQWTGLEESVRTIMEIYNYEELRTPVFEFTELFARGIGQLTDIVSKEMYTFLDRGKKQLTLKPEMTAPIIRSYLENKLYALSPVNKIFYLAPLFRQENPQAGRLRQFHQFGAELLGSAEPHADVEIIALTMHIFQSFGLKDVRLTLNSVGDPVCRESYRTILKDYIRTRLNEYCEDCQRRFEENPMRILDCKNASCSALNQQAPKIADHLCEDCRSHFTEVRRQLDLLEIGYELNPFLVRGLDYYTRTVFEILSDRLGAQNAICGGGRYDLLAEELGGTPTPAVGFAAGIERILIALEAAEIEIGDTPRLDVFLVCLGDQAREQSLLWLQRIRQAGFKADGDFLGRSVKAQFREANRQNARFVLVLGEDELTRKEFSVKLMDQGQQITIPFAQVIDSLKNYNN